MRYVKFMSCLQISMNLQRTWRLRDGSALESSRNRVMKESLLLTNKYLYKFRQRSIDESFPSTAWAVHENYIFTKVEIRLNDLKS
jgi:hypothetical protein